MRHATEPGAHGPGGATDPVGSPGPVRVRLDHALVALLRELVVEQLQDHRRFRDRAGQPELTAQDERQLGRSLVMRALAEHRADQVQQGVLLPPEAEDAAVAEACHQALFGLGRMAPLLADQSLSEINIRGCDDVWLVRDDGSKVRGEPVAGSDEELVAWVRTMATYTQLNSRSWDPSSPRLRCRLPDGSRLAALMGAARRPVLSIRMLRRPRVRLDELRERGTFDDEVQSLLAALVRSRQNVMLSGPTHSGKTTLLRAMSQEIPAAERVITVERFLELGLDEQPDLHPDVVALEEQDANAEGEGGQSLAELVHFSRSLDADRLLVGECLGDEVRALLDGMSQGDDGGMTTIHARSAREVPARIAQYAGNTGMSMGQALLLTSNAVDFVVHLSADRTADGGLRRHVTSIVEIGVFDGQVLSTTEVFGLASGELEPRWLAPVSDSRAAALAAHGFDGAMALVLS